MEEREKGKEEFMGLKLKRGILVGKSKGGVCTPPPTWTFESSHFQQQQQKQHQQQQQQQLHSEKDNNKVVQSCVDNVGSCCSTSVTARQLGANLWEILPHLNSIANMNNKNHNNSSFSKGGGFSKRQSQGLEIQKIVRDPPSDIEFTSDDQPVSTGSFHRQIAASVMRHHRVVDRNSRALQPVSPASYSSSMEVAPYYPAASPSSSIDYKGKMGDPSCSLKTSTELLKVLNRIWCLEEQHASNISVTKGLKGELENARSRMKELYREKQMDKQVIDDLMKQVAEHKLNRKNMEQDRLQSALHSVRQELEDERKLRKHSESLHRKMAREISEIKSSFAKALSGLERERHARILLEDLCDEFAMGIRDYEHELRSLKLKSEKEQVPEDHADNLILHISEAWLDERVQMKLAEEIRKDMGEKAMVVDKLRPEIETFLKARHTEDSREKLKLPTKRTKGGGLRRQSLESYPLNEATSAPIHVEEEEDDDSTDSESNCFELSKNLGGECSNGIYPKNANISEEREIEETVKTDAAGRNGVSHEMNNGNIVTGLQARFERHMARMILRDGQSRQAGIPVGTDTLHRSTIPEAFAEEGSLEIRSKRFGNRGGNSNHILDNLLRNNSSSVEGERIHPVNDLPDENHGHFSLIGPASPVKKWEPKIISQDPEISESSSRWLKGPKENTLKARLLEARQERRNLQSKGFRASG